MRAPGARSDAPPPLPDPPLRGPPRAAVPGGHYDAEEPGAASAAFRANLEGRLPGAWHCSPGITWCCAPYEPALKLRFRAACQIFPISAAPRFAPCIPESRRRAHRDLFRGSLIEVAAKPTLCVVTYRRLPSFEWLMYASTRSAQRPRQSFRFFRSSSCCSRGTALRRAPTAPTTRRPPASGKGVLTQELQGLHGLHRPPHWLCLRLHVRGLDMRGQGWPRGNQATLAYPGTATTFDSD